MSKSPYYVREGFNQSGVIQLHRGLVQWQNSALSMRRSPVRVWYSRHCEGWGSNPQSRQGFWMDKDAVPDSKHKVNGSRSKTQKLLLMSIFPQRLELVNSGNLHYIPLQFSWSEHQICNLVTSVRIRVGDLLLIRLII